MPRLPDRISRPTVWLVGVIVLAAVVRFIGVNWDQGHHFHPDERRIAFAIEELSFSPLQLNPHFFAYGSLPIYVMKAASSIAGEVYAPLRGYDSTITIGRVVSGIAGTLTVWVLFLLGRRLYNPTVGLLAAVLLAACVLHVQNSHFMTTDIFLTFLVLVALYFLIGVVQRGETRDYLYAGLAIGFAGATKFSALPLLAPLGVAALIRLGRERRLLPILARGAVALIATAAAFAVGQPYTLMDFAAWSHDIVEQSGMVRNAGVFPYTNQYVGTPKYFYDVTQMVLWGMAPPLGIVAVWATAARTWGAIRERSAEDLVLLSWVIPFFLVTGWFQVKFVRYLLPIYPVMILWAAAWLWKLAQRSRLGRVALWTVVIGTLLSSLAFLSIYLRPFSVREASEWAYRHIPAGSTILSQHWDEGFPLPTRTGQPGRFKVIELGYYEPDTPAKMREIAQQLAKGDYIAFQTKRLYGAITQAPEKFPQTTNYFYRLFAGDLGYKLIYDHASRPSLFGFEFPTELADESISVYDHPKVLIFQNVERLPVEEIQKRMANPLPSSRQLTRRDLLLAHAGDEEGGTAPAEPIRASWLAFLWFALVVELLGLSAYPILRHWLPVPGSYALAKILGVLVFAYIPWVLTDLDQVAFTREALTGTIVFLALCGAIARLRWRPALPRREWLPTEALFWGVFLFFLLVRAYNPEVFWGEKPMDFSFLNSLTRSTHLPPPEPWFSGSPLHYSYFGHYVVAALGKLCNIHPALTFNLGIALTAGLTATAAFALGCAISDRWGVGLLAAAFATLAGNLAGPVELWSRRAINFDYFWATSRVVPDTINEYPVWSFLFADLHAHVLVMPFSLSFVTLAVWWVRRHEARTAPAPPALPIPRWLLLLLLALTLGAITVTNTWSTFTYLPFFPFLLTCAWLVESRYGWFGTLVRLVPRVALPSAVLGGLTYVLYLPYWRHWNPPERNWGWERDSFVNAGQYGIIFGLFLFVAIPFLFAVWRRELMRGRSRLGVLRSLPMCLVLIAAAVSMAFSVRVGLTILAVLAFHLAVQQVESPQYRLILSFFAFAFAVTAGVDIVHVWDRMNTIFKFYLEAWFLFAVAAAAAAAELWEGGIRWRPLRLAFQAGLVLLLTISVFTTTSSTYAVVNTKRVRTPRPTLDGIAYLPLHDPHESAAFEWLNQNIRGIPVISEAYGPSYQEFARVSMNTGLPTVLGWDYHVFQRAHRWPDINRRKDDLKTLYSTDNKKTAAAILEKYHIALVYVGPLERREYKGGNLTRFNEWSDVLTPIYQNGGVTIYGVNGQFSGAMPVTTIESVPQEAAAESNAPEAPPEKGGPGQFRQPRGIAADSQGNVYVADFDNNRIQKFNSDLEYVSEWGDAGNLPGEFRQPCGIAVDSTDTVYVADTWNQRVQVFTADGQYVREWGGPYFGPRGIGVSQDGKVYLADTGNHRIRRFDAEGNEQKTWGGSGSEPGQFKEPDGIAVAADGRVYVADNNNARVQIFDADGTYQAQFPVDGWEPKAFSEPTMTFTPKGTLFVTVPLRGVIRAYDRSGKLLQEISGDQPPPHHFDKPMGITYNPKTQELYVTDLENRLARVPVPKGL